MEVILPCPCRVLRKEVCGRMSPEPLQACSGLRAIPQLPTWLRVPVRARPLRAVLREQVRGPDRASPPPPSPRCDFDLDTHTLLDNEGNKFGMK
jgi:hypothetical protein